MKKRRILTVSCLLCGLIIFCILLSPEISRSQQITDSEIEKLADQINSSDRKEREKAFYILDRSEELLSEEKVKLALINLLAKESGGKKLKDLNIQDIQDRIEYMRRVLSYISKIKDTRSIPYLLEIIVESYTSRVVLAGIGEPAVEPIIRLLQKGKRDDKLAALATLRMMVIIKKHKYPLSDSSREKIKQLLIKATKDKDPRIRAAAVNVLGNMEDADVIQTLIKVYEDKDPQVRVEVIRKLGSIKNVDVIPALIKATKDEDRVVRVIAAYGLGSIKNVDVIPALIESSEDIDPWVRETAVRSLGNAGNADVIPLIEKIASEDPYSKKVTDGSLMYPVREEAQRASEQLKSMKAKSGKEYITNEPIEINMDSLKAIISETKSFELMSRDYFETVDPYLLEILEEYQISGKLRFDLNNDGKEEYFIMGRNKDPDIEWKTFLIIFEKAGNKYKRKAFFPFYNLCVFTKAKCYKKRFSEICNGDDVIHIDKPQSDVESSFVYWDKGTKKFKIHPIEPSDL